MLFYHSAKKVLLRTLVVLILAFGCETSQPFIQVSWSAFNAQRDLVFISLSAEEVSRLHTHCPGSDPQNMPCCVLILKRKNDNICNTFFLNASAFNLKQMSLECLDFGALPDLSTILPRDDVHAKPSRIKNLYERIRREAAPDSGVSLVGVYQAFADYPERNLWVKSLLSCDLKHLSDKGYEFLAEEWADALKEFPFPPQNFQIGWKYDKILFYEEAGNIDIWQDNEKIGDKSVIQDYRIYRKKDGSEEIPFRLLAMVTDSLWYFDTDITLYEKYTYVLATVMRSGAEGPALNQRISNEMKGRQL